MYQNLIQAQTMKKILHTLWICLNQYEMHAEKTVHSRTQASWNGRTHQLNTTVLLLKTCSTVTMMNPQEIKGLKNAESTKSEMRQ